MLSIRGKGAAEIDAAAVAAWVGGYREVVVDLGTGDGRFVRQLARGCPARAVIGIDTCRDNLRVSSRTAPENALFVVADALALPGELQGVATGVTVNFPWGSLLRGLVEGDEGLLAGLRGVGNGRLAVDVKLNGGAVAEVGLTLEEGAERVAWVLGRNGFRDCRVQAMTTEELRGWPTTWAKRLAFGRDARAMGVRAVFERGARPGG